MKVKSVIYILGIASLFTSCDDFLDTAPDNRAQLDSYEKVRSILIDAYPKKYGPVAMEWSTDNVYDNGPDYASNFQDLERIYKWEPMLTSSSNDSPNDIWNGCYKAVATANQALEAIGQLNGGSEFNPLRAEGLLCRAYGHFLLSNVFCLEYNKETADKDLGLPYSLAPETQVFPKYTRGTMAELYANIDKDIEEALPLVNDAVYRVPKYHFNKRAAYAFAARFNLYYGNFDKAIKYATEAIGDNPLVMMRDWAKWLTVPKTFEDMGNAYIDASLPTNYLIQMPLISLARMLGSSSYIRYAHSKSIATTEDLRVDNLMPWGSYRNLIKAIYGGSSGVQLVRYANIPEIFEYTDKAAGTGYIHTALIPFSGSKLILERAEAYAIKGDLDKAVADINTWMYTATVNKVQATKQQLINLMKAIPYTKYPLTTFADRTVKKILHPQGFAIEPNSDQEMIMHFVLHLKRIEFMHEGERFMDIKRYGIEISHNLNGRDDQYVNLPLDAPNRAIQLPQEVIAAGLTPNPTK